MTEHEQQPARTTKTAPSPFNCMMSQNGTDSSSKDEDEDGDDDEANCEEEDGLMQAAVEGSEDEEGPEKV